MTEPTQGPATPFKPVHGEQSNPTVTRTATVNVGGRNAAAGYPSGGNQTVSSSASAQTPGADSAALPTAPANGGQRPAAAASKGPRRVKLVLSRIDPWSVMKLSFLLSIAVGIAIVTATWVIWTVLNSMGVFASVISVIEEIDAMNQFGPLLEYVELSRIISAATVIAVADVVIMTVIATLGAFIYNLVAAMIGGLHVTFTDE